MSRFNALYQGEPDDAADLLEIDDRNDGCTADELRVALLNALRRIATLERKVVDLREDYV